MIALKTNNTFGHGSEPPKAWGSARFNVMPILVRTTSVALFSALLLSPAVKAQEISQTPLFLGSQVPPNILYILDDSGSMNLSFIPSGYVDAAANSTPEETICGQRTTNRVKSSSYNSIYYDPGVTYVPPLNHLGVSLGNASFTAAKINGYSASSSTVNLSNNFRPTWSGSSTGCSDSNQYAHSDGRAAYYYVFDPDLGGCAGTDLQKRNSDSCYSIRTVSSTSGPGNTDERVNFANWYQYYRTRLMLAKAGSSRAFAQLGEWPRIGYGRINQGSNTVDSVSTTTLQRGVRTFSGTDREQFFNWLFALGTQTFTPLRRALDAAGQYYTRTDERGPYSTTPGLAGGQNLSCRQNYTVLMTDGYWNDAQAATSAARNNNDGTNGSTITGPNGRTYTYTHRSPFTDTRSNTLADVAMYYWRTDLTNLTNNVPTSPQNPAFWQHMVTFGVGLGVPTAVNPEEAFTAIESGATITWPDPETSNTGTSNLPPGRADDLLHAAVNSRGGFFNAQDPDEFATRLSNTLSTIVTRAARSSTAISTTSVFLDTGTKVFQARFDSNDWSGKVLAFQPTVVNDRLSLTQLWDAEAALPLPASRNILSWNGTSGTTFTLNGLTAAQRTPLGADDAERAAVINYIRGVRDGEGGVYRQRGALIGDVINSDPVFAHRENFGHNILGGTEGSTYLSYVNSKISRTPMVYVGANDGMLHAFNANNGAEVFAFVPSAVIPNLKQLTQKDYEHRYYVDGGIHVSDAFIGGSWKTILLGTTGAGGRSVFAIDVTNPTAVDASKVLWEFTAANDADLGFTMGGRPLIARLNNGVWAAIFGNGYGSPSGKAVLYVVNLATGALIRKIDTGADGANGMSAPIFFYQSDGDSLFAGTIYAGDLRGNLWKFNLTANNISNWDVSFSQGQTRLPLFSAQRSGQLQPITTAPELRRHPRGGYLVMFGTGKFFALGDLTDNSVQSIYAIWDNGSRITQTDRSTLQVQSIIAEGTSGGFNTRAVSSNTVDWATRRGWYLDLVFPSNTPQGERVLRSPVVWFDRLRVSTTTPSTDPCSAGASSWNMELDFLTGGRLQYGIFDLNNDGTMDTMTATESGKPVTVPVSGFSTAGVGVVPAVIGSSLATDPDCPDCNPGYFPGIEDMRGRQTWREIR